jgi:hypothetical protein
MSNIGYHLWPFSFPLMVFIIVMGKVFWPWELSELWEGIKMISAYCAAWCAIVILGAICLYVIHASLAGSG